MFNNYYISVILCTQHGAFSYIVHPKPSLQLDIGLQEPKYEQC